MANGARTLGCGVLASVVGLCGCYQTHLRDNAPGNIDVREPPRDIARRAVEEPEDPGEHLLALTLGGLVGSAASVREGTSDTTGAVTSVELSLHYGQSEHSHGSDGMIDPYPFRHAWGFNLGYVTQDPGEALDLSVARPLYLEAQYSIVGWAAAGWQADFERGLHGPQLTAGFGPLYGRFVHRFDFGTQFEAGIVIKGAHTWVWSR
jgi:hypothetical protein